MILRQPILVEVGLSLAKELTNKPVLNIFQICVSEDRQDDQKVANYNHDDDDDHDDNKASRLSDRVIYVVLEFWLAVSFHLKSIKHFVSNHFLIILTTPVVSG